MNDIKTKSKKFYEENKSVIDAFALGFTIAGVVGLNAVSKTKRGMRPARAAEMVDEVTKESFLYITFANGKTGRFLWEKTK